jgi:hypothetical protein
MSARRVARRIASMTRCQNACSDAVSVGTLATKVFHYPCQPFLSRFGGRPVVVGLDGGVGSSTGVGQLLGRGGTA